MRTWKRFWNAFRLRLDSAAHRTQLDRDLEDELSFHLEMKARDNREAGMEPRAAGEQAAKQFGNATLLKEISREMFGFGSLEILMQDLRYGLRMLRNNLGFTTVIVLTLALGIGANTAIFSIINAIMLRNLPVRAPQELVSVGDPSMTGTLSNGGPVSNVFSYPLYRKIRDQNQVFTGLMASGRTGRLELAPGSDETARGELVSGNYFDVLGVRPALGRAFTQDDDRVPGERAVVVISHDYWQRKFAGDSGVVGKSLSLNGTKFTIVGVAPGDFFGDEVGQSTEVWIPLMMQGQVNPGSSFLEKNDSSWLLLLGRLKPGVSLAQARASLNVLTKNLQMEMQGSAITPDTAKTIRESKVPVDAGGKGFSYLRKQFSQPLLILMGLVALVLLIACTNVANLLLARATNRQKEISMRLALGAGRARLVRQLLTESLLLSVMGGLAGLLLAWWGATLLLWLASNGPRPLPLDVRPDPAVLGFTAALAIFTGLVFGLVPALSATRRDLAPALRERTQMLAHSGRRWNLGQVLVVVQVALSLLMLVGAGLFASTLHHLQTMNVGYQRQGLAMLALDPIGSGYQKERMIPLCQNVLVRLRSVPGVSAASLSQNGVFSGTESISSVQVEGYQSTRDEDLQSTFDQVGPHYFATVGIALLQGRDFDEHDQGSAPKVAVINETMAKFYFSGVNPVGRHFTIGRKEPKTYTIVGVSRDAVDHDLTDEVQRRFYLPFFEATELITTYNFEIRTKGDVAAILPGIRKAVQEYDRNLKIDDLRPLTVLMDRTIGEQRLVAQLSTALGVLALVLAATGLYGVMAYATSRRSGEIGLRMALGADRSRVVWMVLREALWLSLLGIVIGVPCALAAAKLVAHSLSGLSAADPFVMTIAVTVMISTALLAGFLPAARASRIDPMTALRQE